MISYCAEKSPRASGCVDDVSIVRLWVHIISCLFSYIHPQPCSASAHLSPIVADLSYAAGADSVCSKQNTATSAVYFLH